jgi:putative intracellular protease/amidase
MAKVLFVVTSHQELGGGRTTGLWLDEYALPFETLRREGIECVSASLHGGAVPIDPRSEEKASATDAAREALRQTLVLQEAGDARDYDAVFIPGGHGAMFDLATSLPLKTLLTEFDAQGKIIAAVCHGPAAFVDSIRFGEPRTLVSGRHITCFTDEEERATGLAAELPYLLAAKLREQGAEVVESAPWSDHVEVDGTWITGQNPQSTQSTADALVRALTVKA